MKNGKMILEEGELKTEPVLKSPLLKDGLSLPPVKKNCFNCKHLEFERDNGEDGMGQLQEYYHCDKQWQKMSYKGTECELEKNLARKEYLEKGKRCFEPKQR